MLEGFVQPVPVYAGRAGVVSDGYHASYPRVHPGIDIMYRRAVSESANLPYGTINYYMPPDTPAVASGPGLVSISQIIGTGGYVQIDHGDGVKTQYMHLNGDQIGQGMTVSAGQPIGIIGNNPQEPDDPNHLHWEVIINGEKVDPEPYFNSLPATEMPLLSKNNLMKIIIAIGGLYVAYELING